jgi:bifunctional non-homologous end joining protein LigD
MLANPADELPDGDWAVEVKWDGVRAAAVLDHGQLRLISRNGRDITEGYPELAGLATVTDQAVLDGEIVASDEQGRPSFERLQQRMHVREPTAIARLATAIPVAFLAFDVLQRAERDCFDEPWTSRRRLLTDLDLGAIPGNWQVPPAALGDDGRTLFEHTRSSGLEGVVAKRTDARYEPGRRSSAWRKVKHFTSQEFIVGGYELGSGVRSGRLGSLLLGVHDDAGNLVFCGGVGTGFTNDVIDILTDTLARIERPTSPFFGPTPTGARFVEPVIVVDVRFIQWTDAGAIRAPSFRGVRPDIDPAQVQRISR